MSNQSSCGHTEHCVRRVPIFNHLNDQDMAEIMSVVHSRQFKKGDHVFHTDDRSEGLYVVHKGKVRIYRLSENGKEQLVRLLLPGDFTGELAIFQSKDHTSFAEALTDASICRISRQDFNDLITDYPSIAVKMLNALANRLDQAEQQTTRFATESVSKRLAYFLNELMQADQSKSITLPMSRKDLALYLGTTPETISRELKRFEKEGYVANKSPREIHIYNLDDLF
ncbi:CRP/FNR family transcriptional regulator, anaerobic regulatory protein [Pelagirhabdus alkalitolerans]|uniref:CRP/FNR family transcriptional regulator, anaerobic regulatory protein n=1 Tax=Pelagirhabdus alkalitolerans TaxID=1612202 RepID=A0A1G6GM26_9BACI|nr:Crp/Fnr family transcriptional regulator [Pelagirhabdus alkalitolerans]SDB82969.1 CRP/FNR family transcriptional regulator, anaerobic regulatory protein [Pelagirhabdus alkalitolerans]